MTDPIHATIYNYTFLIFSEDLSEDDGRKQLKVTMVSWDATDKWVITAVNDFSVSLQKKSVLN